MGQSMKKLFYSAALLVSLSSSAGVLPSTVGKTKLMGVPVTYNVGGVLNYTQGFADAESGIYNSQVNANATYSVGGGYDVTNSLKVGGGYSFEKSKNTPVIGAEMSLIKDNSKFSIGYDKHISNELFSTVTQSNGDVGFSHNQLASIMDKYSVYIDYTVSVRGVEFDAAADINKNGYIGFKVPFLGGDLATSVYRLNGLMGGYSSYAFNLDNGATASVGVGVFNKKLGSVVSIGKFIGDDFYMYANLINYSKDLTGTLGAEYDMGRVSLYSELSSNLLGANANNKLAMLGVKFVF